MDLVLHVRQRSSLQQLLHHVIEADRQLSKLHHYLVKLQDLSQSLNDIDAASAIPLIDESVRFLHQAVFVVSIRKLQYFTELQRNLRAYHQQWDDIPDVDLHDLWQCWHTQIEVCNKFLLRLVWISSSTWAVCLSSLNPNPETSTCVPFRLGRSQQFKEQKCLSGLQFAAVGAVKC